MNASSLKRVRNILASYALGSSVVTAAFFFVAREFYVPSKEEDYETPLIILMFLAFSVVFTITAMILSFEIAAERRSEKDRTSLIAND
jgi:phosphotransferase system  glucose/maltose/N-acetylglucosamine-specific IIC component